MEPAQRPEWFDQPCALGIDEAGRGPVLGPMVYACALCTVAEASNLAAKGYTDSKALGEERRAALLAQMQGDESIDFEVESLPAQLISSQMLSRDRISLNQLAMDATCALIERTLGRGANVTECYVDTVGDADKYKDRLSARFPGVAFTVCPKADALYAIVGAASIAAKVFRDEALARWVPTEGECVGREYGSGYPGDPATKQWLSQHVEPTFGFPSLVRASWATCRPLLEGSAARVAWECEEDASQPTLDFGGGAAGGVKRGSCAQPHAARHAFFKARRLQLAGAVF